MSRDRDVSRDVDIIFSAIDDMYWDAVDTPSKRNKIDLVLSQVSDDMPTTLLVGFLTITIPHKEEFKYRTRILDMIKSKHPDRPGLWEGLE